MIEFIRNASCGLSIPIAVIVTEPGCNSPPTGTPAQEWYFDTGYQGDAFCWDFHLERASLSASTNRVPDRSQKHWTSLNADQESIDLPVRRADLWIVSNVEELRECPMRLELEPGIAVRERVTLSAESAKVLAVHREPRAIVGMKALRRAGVRLDLRFREGVFSLFVPSDYARPALCETSK